ncbi:probable phospholipid-transporting ATPase IA isoform X3 [Amphibalanus amphitrite]|uniref:probable phospholipid-transporting ATPase IA isoform X3 n=1 Tax=Amphibalanus amphitrite TaxID=1232801 RepID=UPI001C926997|nr:probable phospholipid-transporting ATPase IA isoform X3 [Amphibalanus amphitrite]
MPKLQLFGWCLSPLLHSVRDTARHVWSFRSVSVTSADECADTPAESHEDSRSVATGAPEVPESRTVYINKEQPPNKCMSNSITTAKYSVFSFLPKFLFEQFRRYSNIFFLFIALLQQIPDVSPTGKYTTLTPLVCILTISAVKEFIEDWKRHRADDEINSRQVEVLDHHNWQWKRWSDVVVGNICKVRSDQYFPADLVLLSSSEPQSICYIETANLDGETNLKIRQGLPQTARLLDTRDLDQLSASVECELPNRVLYEFVGTLKETGKTAVPLGPDQLLLRGAKLKNTTWVFGAAVYTGHETKLMKNSSAAPLKRSTMDKATNTQIIYLFGLLVVLCVISAVASEVWTKAHQATDWYLGLDEMSTVNFGYNLLTFIILYNNLIPISLQVTVEIARFIQALYINMDHEMYHEPTDTPAMARTSNLNEELGQVKYVLTDKTGTLTQNVMEFKKCTIAGVKFSSLDELRQALQDRDPDLKSPDAVQDFLMMMAVCHTVIPEEQERSTGTIVYHAASPDERALVEGARRLGFTFTTRTPQTVSVEAYGQLLQFDVLNVLEFTSTRKRMSVIIRQPNGRIQLMCKGADTVIYERLGDPRYKDDTLSHLAEFASEGLRTLCLAVADIPEQEYKEWQETYHKASTAIQCREEKVEDAARLIETNLVLLGATAIEDKLQDKVPETIEALLAADIHVWVLTGDKQETAINIGHSSRLLHSKMPLLILNEDGLDRTRAMVTERLNEMRDHREEAGQVALIIDGRTLQYALTHELRSEFMELCLGCRSVVCCRVSPGQKAEVAELVTQHTGAVTLAIGDGANDVAMIQAAHVGVGVAGLEGLQAAHSSDYAIGQFRFLARLLFVHGAWNYSRLTQVVLYSFYKNICLYVMELWYAIYSGWSGQVVFERWTIAAYNLLFTSVPPLIMGFIDRSCSAETRLKYPQLYKTSQEGQLFSTRVFWLWIINSLVHSVMLFWLSYGTMTQDVAWSSGRNAGYLMFGNMVYTYVVVTVSLKAGLEMQAWTCLTHLAIWGSIGVWFAFLLIYSHLPFAHDMIGLDTMVFTSPVFWLGLIMVPTATILPDVIFKSIRSTVHKTLTDEVRESEIKARDPSIIMDVKEKDGAAGSGGHSDSGQSVDSGELLSAAGDERSPLLADQPVPLLTERARLLRNVKNVFRRTTTRVDLEVELSHGYAFSQEEGGAVPQADIIRAYDTTRPKPTGM